jgi:ParB family chromosome partitioning protein
VREDGTIINGHKRIKAARVAGLDHHPVEVIDVTDDQAAELFAVAHRSQLNNTSDGANDSEDGPEDEEQDSSDDANSESD